MNDEKTYALLYSRILSWLQALHYKNKFETRAKVNIYKILQKTNKYILIL